MPELVTLTVDTIAASGDAVGRDPETGKVIFVPDAIPGERVAVEIVEDRPRWQRGRLRRVIEASPDRVDPPCPYFGPPQPVTLPDGTQLNPTGEPRCAGCVWQHIAYERQLALKRDIVIEHLTRQAALDADPQRSRRRAQALVEDVSALGDPRDEEAVLDYGYLTQMVFRLNDAGQLCLPTRADTMGDAVLIPIDFCLLHHEQLADLFDAFAVDEENGSPLVEDLGGVEMAVGATADAIGEGDEGMLVLQSLHGDAPSLELDLPVNVLLQRPQGDDLSAAELLVGDWSYPIALGDRRLIAYPSLGGPPMVWPHSIGNEAVAAIAAGVLGLQPFEHLLHIWAGAGLTTVGIAQRASTVIAVEDNELAVAALQANTAGLDNVDIHRGPAEKILKQIRTQGYEVDVALLTPWNEIPTSEIVRQLDLLRLRRFVIVLDDGEALARLVPTVREYGFDLAAVQPLDLQPQQETVTLVARFDRSQS